MISIRLAIPERDAARIAEIYAPHVAEGLASFEAQAPDATEMAARIRKTLEWTPWLVAEHDQLVVGYAYASRHRERAGYRWSVDISVYVDPDWQGRGLGRSLYAELLDILRRQGFINAYAGITVPNAGSVGLHEAIGMRRLGTFEKVGYKFGAWHDVAWYALRLTEPGEPPAEPIALPMLRERTR